MTFFGVIIFPDFFFVLFNFLRIIYNPFLGHRVGLPHRSFSPLAKRLISTFITTLHGQKSRHVRPLPTRRTWFTKNKMARLFCHKIDTIRTLKAMILHKYHGRVLVPKILTWHWSRDELFRFTP